MASPNLESRISSLAQEIDALSSEIQDEALRKKLLGVVMQGQSKVESPLETVWRLISAVSVTL
jgi:hypothetical protein